jgi:WD40 repeat protein
MVAELKGHSGPIMAINYHPIDRLVCTASKDGTVKIWSLSSFSCVGTAAASVVVDLMGADNATARSNVNSSSATPSLECRGCR